jgi:hypothetical protein
MKTLCLAIALLLSATLMHAQQPAMGIFDRMASLDLLNDPDMGRALDEEDLGPFHVGILSAGANMGFAAIAQIEQPKAGPDGWTLGLTAAAASPMSQSAAAGLYMPRPFETPSWLGLSVSFLHQVLTDVPQDILGPVFADSQSTVAAPDPYTNRSDYEAAIAAGQEIPAQYLMTCDTYNLTLGVNLGLVIPLSFGKIRFQGGWNPKVRYVSYDPSLYRPFDAALRGNANSWNIIDRIVLGAYVDGRDTFREPTRGFFVGQTVMVAGGVLLGSRDFIRSDTRLEGFLTIVHVPLGPTASLKVVLAAHSALSLLLPNFSLPSLAWQTNLENSEKFTMDGISVVRGIRSLRQGNALWDNKLELRIPVGDVWLVGFFDSAAVWEEPFRPPLGDLFLYSFGFGLRLSSPTFPLRLYLAQGFAVRNGQFFLATGRVNIGALSFSLVAPVGGDTF